MKNEKTVNALNKIDLDKADENHILNNILAKADEPYVSTRSVYRSFKIAGIAAMVCVIIIGAIIAGIITSSEFKEEKQTGNPDNTETPLLTLNDIEPSEKAREEVRTEASMNPIYTEPSPVPSDNESEWRYTEFVSCKYDEVYDFSEGLAAVCIGDWQTGKWGYIDKNGNEVISFGKYDIVKDHYNGVSSDFYDGLAAVTLNEKIGFIDKTGKEIIPFMYDWVSGFSDGFAVVNVGAKDIYVGGMSLPFGGKWGFITFT